MQLILRVGVVFSCTSGWIWAGNIVDSIKCDINNLKAAVAGDHAPHPAAHLVGVQEGAAPFPFMLVLGLVVAIMLARNARRQTIGPLV